MPPYPEDKESQLEARLRKKHEATEDRNVFVREGADPAGTVRAEPPLSSV
jgi:hypothetical protein